jgi:hypothetical protein
MGPECPSDDRRAVFLSSERHGAAHEKKEGKMSSRVTLSRVIGLVFLVAALGSGYGSASAATGETPQGLKADGLRWQGLADRYIQLRGTTPLGLQADGLRYQAMARFYANRPAASFYTPQALKADGLRWQAMGRFYTAQSASTRSSSTGFDWGSAAIGGAGMIVIALGAGLLVFGVRKVRQERLAV